MRRRKSSMISSPDDDHEEQLVLINHSRDDIPMLPFSHYSPHRQSNPSNTPITTTITTTAENNKIHFWPFSIWTAVFGFTIGYYYLFHLPGNMILYMVVICIGIDIVINTLRILKSKIRHQPSPKNYQPTSGPHENSVKRLVRTVLSWMILIMFPFLCHMAFRLCFDTFSDVEFTRVGLVDLNSAHLFLRYPPHSSVDSTTSTSDIALQLKYREFGGDETAWNDGPVVTLSRDKDWTGNVHLTGLKQSSIYEYQWQNVINGIVIEFSTCGRRKYRHAESLFHLMFSPIPACPSEDRFILATSYPTTTPHAFTFSFGSCMIPDFPYGRSMPGLELMSKHQLDFFISLGDFIYGDFGVLKDRTADYYRMLYRQVFGRPESARLISKTAVIGTIDDHEIQNNWHSDMPDHGKFNNAIEAFKNYIGSYSTADNSHDGLDITFENGPAAFFIMDTRSFRRNQDTNGNQLGYDNPERSVLGSQQKSRLLKWLVQVNQTHTFKIIASSVPFTYSYRNADTWYGYQHERQQLTNFININNISNVIILSGDRHQVSASKIVFANGMTDIHDFSVSPINQFSIPIPFFYDAFNSARTRKSSFSSLGIDEKDSEWVEDETLYYSPLAGKFAFGKVEIDSTGVLSKQLECPGTATTTRTTTTDKRKDALLFCIVTESPLVSSVDETMKKSASFKLCEQSGPGKVLFSYHICPS